MSAEIPVDYYASLEIPSTASQQQIRDAYKKAALRHHPDRVPADSPERATRTKKFQQINDAYYTLSDPTRRRDYDASRNSFHGFTSTSSGPEKADEDVPRPDNGGTTGAGGGTFPWSFFNMFGGRAKSEEDANKYSNEQFGSVFEEMMRDEGLADGEDKPTGHFWSVVGGISGGAMGFIVANMPGALAGAVGGNRLGAIRDKRGKSVYSVYQELEQPEKMRLLSELASKVFAHAIS
ncbi:DnaJ-domain-containing protein [Teratosphaeria nubilosa]|uniref:DnaJ-domain-containing protein n=1 Tax=Teratosphaeria nubilosa TaxID=161662 RepID=A0A6G1KZK4_9PEZI|nr:DnaJ-domain-containing protein [Teratosphaeria nubilosa]